MKTIVVQEEKSIGTKESLMFFPEGIIGFSDHKEFEIVCDKSKEPFVWMKSIKDNSLAFIIIDPKEFKQEYNPVLSISDKAALQIDNLAECSIYSLVCVPKQSDEISANLLAPIIINKNTKIGRQVILQEQDYSVKHLILEDMLRKIEDTDVSSFSQAK